MNTWTSEAARSLAQPQEVRIVARRADGTLRNPRIIWIVRDGERVFIRSTNGRSADWFRWAIATGSGQLLTGNRAYEVVFAEAEQNDLPAIDAAYRTKYGHYASIVDHLEEPGPRAATLHVLPA
ncbi:DUF2255 family protein [Kineosporia sp. J2-2]|uniref:DUF2255 family protein n=1 Tax=Kineosporia corallincola TaxID=2835133 RepID=A0ABS5TTW5_9ACTN|nr:DUF2255 family protein [Kineosporia corallincola]MBT0774235.1 DUF2255 family protein [Kineosporia corallincola]